MDNDRLYINGHLIDLKPNQPIAKTLQVNDIAKLSDRQTNYTRAVDIPMTPRNIRAMDYLGVIGNGSNVPYQKNAATYFVGNECLINEGWANISQTSDSSYKLNVYDGTIDFFKAIENKTLTDVGIADLNHIKNLDNVIASWTGGTPYRYIVADYNGKKTYVPSGETLNHINVDYILPSANVKYLWDRIFDHIGYSYTGSVFETNDFENLWMTYPKAITNGEQQELLEFINYQTWEHPIYTTTPDYVDPNLLQDCFTNTHAESFQSTDGNCRSFTPTASGLFNFKLKGYLRFTGLENGGGVKIKKRNIVTNAVTEIVLLSGITYNTYIDSSHTFAASDDERVSLVINPDIFTPWLYGNLEITLSKVIGESIDFENALIEFQVKDFIDEILQRFSLTMFTDKFEKSVDFLTTAEWLESDNIINWSKKFQKMVSTTYALKDYAQANLFKYEYNDNKATHNDGAIYVDNVNLKDSKTVIQSTIYSPEKNKEFVYDIESNVYKFWNKEVKDNGSVDYKVLEKRHYFLRSVNHNFLGATPIGTEAGNSFQTITSCQRESFDGLSFKEILVKYYNPIGSILNSSKLITAEFYLTAFDFNNFDFRSLVYVDQLGGYFLVNKILNFIDGRKTKVELIEVDYQKKAIEPEFVPTISSTGITVSGCEVTLTFETNVENPNLYLVGSDTAPVFPYTFSQNFYFWSGNTITVTVPYNGIWEFRLYLGTGQDGIATPLQYATVSNCVIPVDEDLTFIRITSLQTMSVIANVRKVRIYFETDLVLPDYIDIHAFNWLTSANIVETRLNVSANYVEIDLEHVHHVLTGNNWWNIYLQHGGIYSVYETSH